LIVAGNGGENGNGVTPLSPSATAFPNTPLRRLRKKGKSVAFSHEEVLHLAPTVTSPTRGAHRLHARSNSMGDGAIMGGINVSRINAGNRDGTSSGASSPRLNPVGLRSSLRAAPTTPAPTTIGGLHAIPDS